jgi:hypothetical protein
MSESWTPQFRQAQGFGELGGVRVVSRAGNPSARSSPLGGEDGGLVTRPTRGRHRWSRPARENKRPLPMVAAGAVVGKK